MATNYHGLIDLAVQTERAEHARIAARNRAKWGRFATARYCARRGVSRGLYQVAVAVRAEMLAIRADTLLG